MNADANADGDAKMQMLRFLNGRSFFVFLLILISISTILETVISRHCQSKGLENRPSYSQKTLPEINCDHFGKIPVTVTDLDFSKHPKYSDLFSKPF